MVWVVWLRRAMGSLSNRPITFESNRIGRFEFESNLEASQVPRSVVVGFTTSSALHLWILCKKIIKIRPQLSKLLLNWKLCHFYGPQCIKFCSRRKLTTLQPKIYATNCASENDMTTQHHRQINHVVSTFVVDCHYQHTYTCNAEVRHSSIHPEITVSSTMSQVQYQRLKTNDYTSRSEVI